MGSVKVDEIGVSVGQKERPNGLSVGSRSASDKNVDRRRRASQTGSSSHREPGIGGWQLELVQAYTVHTHFGTHHCTSHLEKMYLCRS